MRLHVSLPGYEDLSVELNDQGEILEYHLQSSSVTMELFESLLGRYGRKIAQWQLAMVLSSAASLEERRAFYLLGELIAKARVRWELPYAGSMVCNCRQVTSEQIDHAVVAGAMDVADVSSWTTACTSCTSCRAKIEDIIKFRAELADQLLSLTKVKRV